MLPLWIPPFCLIGAGVGLMLSKSTPARVAGFLLIVSGASHDVDVWKAVILTAIGLAVVAGGWIVKMGR